MIEASRSLIATSWCIVLRVVTVRIVHNVFMKRLALRRKKPTLPKTFSIEPEILSTKKFHHGESSFTM